MEEWNYLDERRLERSYDSRVCVSCVHFAHGVDSHCRTLVACQLHRGQLQQGDHLTRRCEHWKWAAEAAIALKLP